MNMNVDLKELKTGDALPALTRRIAQERIDAYAEASGDHNPIHIDPEFARKTALGGTVAHGMLVLAYVSELMTAVFRDGWTHGGHLAARFKGAAYPGDTVTVSGTVTKVESRRLTCEVQVRNQKGEPVILCEAAAEVPA
jgi:3-hydroxybutyryl-CoA dehydratase